MKATGPWLVLAGAMPALLGIGCSGRGGGSAGRPPGIEKLSPAGVTRPAAPVGTAPLEAPKAAAKSPEEIRGLVAALVGDPYYVPGMGMSSRPDCGFSKTMLALRDIGPAAEPYLIEGLKGPNPKVQRSIAMVLGLMGGTDGARALRNLIRAGEEPEVVEGAVKAVGDLRDQASGEKLVDALGWKDRPGVRIEAARALMEIRYPPAVSRLMEALDDADPAVRAAAFEALKRTVDRDVLRAIVAELKTSSGQKRLLLVQVVGACGPDGIPALVGLASPSEDRDTRSAAITMLARLAPASLPGMTLALSRALAKGDSESFERLARPLARHKHEPARAILIQSSGSSDAKIRQVSTELLAAWGV